MIRITTENSPNERKFHLMFSVREQQIRRKIADVRYFSHSVRSVHFNVFSLSLFAILRDFLC